MAIEFYKEFGDLGYLANYSPHGFYKNGVYYKTVEHYYQSEKYDDKAIKKRIIEAGTPKEASNIGRDRNNIRINNFKAIKNEVMLIGILEKFRQNKDIMYKLIETRNQPIMEKTVDEYYWGVGKDYSGENNVGKILMHVRTILKQEILRRIIFNSDKEVYILGHNNPDFDSLASSYLLKNILNSFNIKAHYVVLDKDYNFTREDAKLIQDFLKEKPEVISEIGDKKFILVDHNTLDGIPKQNVIGSIDHHKISGEVDDVLEMEYASTGLLIYDLFKDIYNFSDEEKRLIGLTVVADTDYLHSSRFSEEDKKLFDELNLDINVNELQEKYFTTTDFSNGIENVINENIKNYTYNDEVWHRVLISSYSKEKEKYMDLLINYFSTLGGNWLLIWNDYEKNETYIYDGKNEYEINNITKSTYKILNMIELKEYEDIQQYEIAIEKAPNSDMQVYAEFGVYEDTENKNNQFNTYK